MTFKIELEIVGDSWHNPDAVARQLDQTDPNSRIVLDARSEGASLQELGVINIISNWASRTGVDLKNIGVTRWSNSVEIVPFTKIECNTVSHFFKMSRDYWGEPQFTSNAKLFGLFIGRSTRARLNILYDAHSTWENEFLLSKMASNYQPGVVDLDADWPVPKNFVIHSIDGKSVRDQYSGMGDCNQSLLNHYHKFCVEIICETYTRGVTFFPTEKTVRPIMAVKPFLVYGPQNYLKNLRSLGFKTYHDYWDESYDQYEGPARWQAMKAVINNLSNLNILDRVKMLERSKEVANYNRTHLKSFL